MSPDVHSNLETQQAYHAYTVYRSVVGQAAKPSRRLQRFLTANESRVDELEYLEKRAALETISETAAFRLHYLRQYPRLKFVPAKKLRRELTLGAMQAALQAAQAWTRKQFATFYSQLQIDWSHPLSVEDIKDFVILLGELGFGTKQSLIKGLQSSASSPLGYRMEGAKNRAWLTQAESKGLKVAPWLRTPSRTVHVLERVSSKDEVRTRRLIVRLSNDPRDILWMGRPFSSCLDLRGGYYCASVVANWMDANKQLIVVSDQSGKMIARKLLALTDDLGLVGYHLYSSLDGPESSSKTEISESSQKSCTLEEHIYQFCMEWAKEIGASLIDEGTPRSLHGTQWYNDGEVAWKH
jgi:hypothetical protein